MACVVALLWLSGTLYASFARRIQLYYSNLTVDWNVDRAREVTTQVRTVSDGADREPCIFQLTGCRFHQAMWHMMSKKSTLYVHFTSHSIRFPGIPRPHYRATTTRETRQPYQHRGTHPAAHIGVSVHIDGQVEWVWFMLVIMVADEYLYWIKQRITCLCHSGRLKGFVIIRVRCQHYCLQSFCKCYQACHGNY